MVSRDAIWLTQVYGEYMEMGEKLQYDMTGLVALKSSKQANMHERKQPHRKAKKRRDKLVVEINDDDEGEIPDLIERNPNYDSDGEDDPAYDNQAKVDHPTDYNAPATPAKAVRKGSVVEEVSTEQPPVVQEMLRQLANVQTEDAGSIAN